MQCFGALGTFAGREAACLVEDADFRGETDFRGGTGFRGETGLRGELCFPLDFLGDLVMEAKNQKGVLAKGSIYILV